jgi:hypothetical protein
MPRLMRPRKGILFAVLPLLALSCGKRSPTEPTTLAADIPAVPVYDAFYNPIPALTVGRELLIDGRATQIEWDASGVGNFILLRGVNGGGDYFANLRAEWTRDEFQHPIALQLLLQWPDLTENRIDHPIVDDSIDVYDAEGNLEFDCSTDNRVIRPTSWHRGNDVEDQVEIEIFPTSMGGYPHDNWRWGAATTDPCTPVSPIDFPGADSTTDATGAHDHPLAGFCEDRWDMGAGPVDDQGPLSYAPNYTQYPDGVVPKVVASKATRDSRLNRNKPLAYVLWGTVDAPLTQCTILNPIRVDDATERDKSWNPGDYVPGWILGMPFPQGLKPAQILDLIANGGLSSGDVIARGTWLQGKWSLEIRRLLDTGHTDDVALVPPDPANPSAQPTVYGVRIRIRDGQTNLVSQSTVVPLILEPAPSK